jgi:hypothetical protein
MLTSRQARRVIGATIGAGAVASALLVGTAPSALADPPNCTAADLASHRGTFGAQHACKTTVVAHCVRISLGSALRLTPTLLHVRARARAPPIRRRVRISETICAARGSYSVFGRSGANPEIMPEALGPELISHYIAPL